MAAKQFAAITGGVDHPRVSTARNRLDALEGALTSAAGGLSSITRTIIDVVVLAVVGWTTATFTGTALHLSSSWAIAVTLGVVLAAFWPCWFLTNRVAWLVNRRRLASAEPVWKAAPLLGATPDGVFDVLRSLLAARRNLIATANRQSAGRMHAAMVRTPAGFLRARERWPAVYWLSYADLMLCQAIDSIEIWARITVRSKP